MEGFGILQVKLPELTKLLLDNFISPLLKGNYSISISNQTLTLQRESNPSDLNTKFTSLSLFITYISSSLHPRALRSLKPEFLPSIIEIIQETILSTTTSIPVSELHHFDNLVKQVLHLNRHFVDLEWARSTSLKDWADHAPQIWFEGRQAVFLNDTRILVGEFFDSPDIVITHGIDIMADLSNQEHPLQTDTSTSSSVLSQNNGQLGPKIGESDVIDEDESDGWKFDEEEEEEVGTSEVDDNNNPLDTSEWKWEDNDDELENGNDKVIADDDNGNNNDNNDSDAFPYSISAIPDKLMDLINKLLDESIDL
jgi:hypothetical protein